MSNFTSLIGRERKKANLERALENPTHIPHRGEINVNSPLVEPPTKWERTERSSLREKVNMMMLNSHWIGLKIKLNSFPSRRRRFSGHRQNWLRTRRYLWFGPNGEWFMEKHYRFLYSGETLLKIRMRYRNFHGPKLTLRVVSSWTSARVSMELDIIDPKSDKILGTIWNRVQLIQSTLFFSFHGLLKRQLDDLTYHLRRY